MEKQKALWNKVGTFTFYYSQGQWDLMLEQFESIHLELLQLSGPLLDELIESPAKIPAARKQLADHGLSIAALGAYCNLVSSNPDKQQRNVVFVKACLERANELGTLVISTETGTLHPEGDWSDTGANYTRAAWDALYRVLDELVPAAEKSGSFLALEGYVNNILKTHDQVQQILTHYSSPNLKIMCDPYNYISTNLLPYMDVLADEFLGRFKDSLVVAHLKDVSSQGAEVDTPEFGTGVFPQAGYLKFLKHHRPDMPLIFEHLPFEHLPLAIERLVSLQEAA